MNKLKQCVVAVAALFGAVQAWGATVEVSTWSNLKANLEAGNSVKLTANITQTGSSSLWISKTTGSVVLDLNGCTITQANDGKTANYLVYDSAGTVKLSIKDSAGGGAIVGNSSKATTGGFGGGGFYLSKSGSSLTLDSGTLKNFRLDGSSSTLHGGCIYVSSGCSFTMNGGTISGCTTTGNGGAIYNAGGTVTMNSGTITGCTAATHGGGVYNAKTFTMNGGEITGNKTTSGCGGGAYVTGSSAAFTMNGGTISSNTAGGTAGGTGLGGGMYNAAGATTSIYCGSIVDNVANRYGGGVFTHVSRLRVYGGTITGNEAKNNDGGGIQTDSVVDGANSTIIYGGVITGNTAKSGHNCLFANQTTSQNTTVYGGVFDVDPATVSYIGCASGYASTVYGSNYIVGKNVAQASGELTAGTYTFNPTNAEYVAAGVAVKDGKTIREIPTTPTKYVVGDPATLTMEDPVETVAGSGVFAAATTVQGDITVISVSVTDGKLNLTQVSGDGFTFKNGVVSSSEGHATPKTGVDYTSVQLSATSAAAATTAMNSIRYVKLGLNNAIKVSATSAAPLVDGDYYLNGHYYTLSPNCMYWDEAMEWAYNLQNASGYSDRYPGYRSYPVTVTSAEENSMMVTIWKEAHSGYKTQVWLPVVPKNFSSGTSIVVGGSEGARTVTVNGIPYAYESDTWTRNGLTDWYGIYGMGERYVWMTGVPEAGEELPAESNTHNANGTYWSAGNPANRGAVYFGHPTLGSVWDDLRPNYYDNVWTSFKTNDGTLHMYALAEWEPVAGFEPEEVETEVSATFVTVTIPTVEHTTYTNVTVGATSVTPVNNVITVAAGTTVTVYYKADDGYELTGDDTATLTNVTEDHKTIDVSKVTVAKAAYFVEVDDDSEYEPTQIVNGGFEIEPWMNYVYNNKTYTFADRDAAWSIPIFSPVSSSITNGVDGGWNTTENQLGIGSLFEWIKGATDSRYPYITQYKVASLPSGSMGAVELNSLNPSSLYQDLTTHGGDVIRWTLAHAPTCQAGATVQTMQVEVGGPTGDASGTGSYIDTNIGSDSKATYTVNGVTQGGTQTYGYATSDMLAGLSVTRSTTWQTVANWKIASGIYVVPSGQDVTRFAFVSTCTEYPSNGNLLDDVTFSTLIGNLKALVNDDGSVTITGYWGDSDTSKKLMIKIGDGTADAVDMSGVLNQNFKITVAADKIGDANVLEVYHQDYESAKRTVTIGYAVTLNLNADDATCAKLETYQRGAVTVLPIPTRTGYSFKGWFENAELTGTAVTQIEATATGAKEFYAKWQGPLIQVGDDAWAWVTNGLCEVTGTTATWDFTSRANPLDGYWRAITNIVVCDGVQGLGRYTFYKFFNATNITFAASVTNLAQGSVFHCLSLRQVTYQGSKLPTMGDNALNIHAGIRMEGDTPVVYATPNVTVAGKELILKGKDKLTDAEWQTVKSGEEGKYHFFKYEVK